MAEIKVQRGTTDIGNTGGTDTSFTAVSTTESAFEVNLNNQYSHQGSTSSTGNMEADDMSGTIELTDSSTLTFTRTAASLAQNMRFGWEIWEYTGAPGGANEFIVRSRNTVAMSTAADGTAALDNTPTNIDDCIPFITGVESTVTTNGEDHLTCTAYINDSGTLVVERGGGDGSGTTTVQVVTVEFTGSNWEVYHGRATGQTGDTGSITLNTDSDGAGGSTGDVTSWATAFITGYHQITNNAEGLAHQAIRWLEGTGTTSVNWAYDGGHNATHDYMVHVLRHPDMDVTRYNVSDTGPLITSFNIASAGLTDLTAASIRGYSQTSGTGDALGRGWRNYAIVSSSSAEATCHRTGNTMQHQAQIIDLSGITTAAGTASGSGSADGIIATVAAVGAVGPRIYLNTASTTAGATRQTLTAFATTSARFDHSGPTGTLVLGIQNAANSAFDWIPVSVSAPTASATVSGDGSVDGLIATVAGTGERVITGQSDLDGYIATVDGTGERVVTGSASADGYIPTVDGTGVRTIVDTDATPATVISLVDGTGDRTVTGDGSADGYIPTVSGVGERTITGSGSADGLVATVDGSGNVGGVTTGAGSADGYIPTVSGVGERAITADGSADGYIPTVSGIGERTVTGAGSADGLVATLSAIGERIITGSGSADGILVTVDGSGNVVSGVTGTGSADGYIPTVAGVGERTIVAVSSIDGIVPTVSGVGNKTITFAAAVSANAAIVAGVGIRSGIGEFYTYTGSKFALINDTIIKTVLVQGL